MNHVVVDFEMNTVARKSEVTSKKIELRRRAYQFLNSLHLLKRLKKKLRVMTL